MPWWPLDEAAPRQVFKQTIPDMMPKPSEPLVERDGLLKSQLEYQPAVDGLRAVAVLAVILFHLDPVLLPGGFVGVDIFFVISGYLITSILIREMIQGRFSLRHFYQRRIARILPSSLVVAALVLVCAAFLYRSQDFGSVGANFVAVILSVANVKFMLQGHYFEASRDAQPLLHFWSLSLEEQFYLLFPVLLASLMQRGLVWTRQVLLMLAILSFGACLAMGLTRPTWAFYLLPTRAFELLCGSLLGVYRVMNGREGQGFRKPAGRPAATVLFCVLMILSFVLVPEGRSFPGFWVLLPLAAAVVCLGSLGTAETLMSKWLSFPPLVRVGKLSFALYLCHWPVFAFVDYTLYSQPSALLLAIKIALTLILSLLLHLWIEKPCRDWLNRSDHVRLAYSLATLAILVCVPLGMQVRRTSYISPSWADIQRGGLVFKGAASAKNGVFLMGDSHGAMYGRLLVQVCSELGCRLVVTAMPGEDPLPGNPSREERLWLGSLKSVEAEQPELVVLACNWAQKLDRDAERLRSAVQSLKKYCRHIVIINQPPRLPAAASREGLRHGAKPPFFEDADSLRDRTAANDWVRTFEGEGVWLIDVASKLTRADGSVRFADARGRFFYHDSSHLSDLGAELVADDLRSFISKVVGMRISEKRDDG